MVTWRQRGNAATLMFGMMASLACDRAPEETGSTDGLQDAMVVVDDPVMDESIGSDFTRTGTSPQAQTMQELPPRCEGGAECCGDLPPKILTKEVSWNFASGVCLVASGGVSAVVDVGHDNVIVAGAGDQLVLAPHARLVFGNEGNDVLKVHGGIVVPGAGADWVRVGPGGHAVLHDPCELAPGTVLVGGPGSTLTTPLDPVALAERGVWAFGFDAVDVRPTPCRAACRLDDVCFAHEVALGFDEEGHPVALDATLRPVDPRPSPRLPSEPVEIGPLLADRLEAADPTEPIEGVTVEMASEIPLPVLPRFVAAAPREAAVNQAIADERRALLAELREARLAEQAAAVAVVEAAGGVVRAHMPVAGILVADLPADGVLDLVDVPVVRRMELSFDIVGPPPPVPGGEDAFSMLDARTLTGADGLRASGADGEGYHVGLVDTGVSDHPLLESSIGIREDCQVAENGQCIGSEPTDCLGPGAGPGHGTSSAAVVAGSDAFGPEDRGVTLATVDSWRVYSHVAGCRVTGPAEMEAGLLSAAMHADLVVGNLQLSVGFAEYDVALSLGDSLYALGVPLVAAAGNGGPEPDTVTAPGRAQNTLAVGAVRPPSLDVTDYSGRGPGDLGLVKPNVLGPTNLITACVPGSNDAECPPPDYGWKYTGTSAATPFVGGVATLLLHAYDLAGGAGEPAELLPGRLYATLTAFAAPPPGDDEVPDDVHGAGLLQVGPTPCSRWRWLTLQLPDEGGLASADVGFGPQGAEDVRIGAWWSNKENGQTSLPPWDVALRLVRDGTVHEAFTPNTNFQRLRVPALAGGTWTIEVETVGSAPFTGRRVHVFVYYRLPDIACTFGIPEEDLP